MNNAILESVKSLQAIQNHFKGGKNLNEYRTVWSRANQNLLLPHYNLYKLILVFFKTFVEK